MLSREVRSCSDALEDTGCLLDMTVEGPTHMSLTKRASEMLGEEGGLQHRKTGKQESVALLSFALLQDSRAVLPGRE